MFRIYKRLQGLSTRGWTHARVLAAAGLLAGSTLRGLPAARAYFDEERPRGANIYQAVTGDDVEEDRRRWDSIYDTKTYVFGKDPARFLTENARLLPKGRALDIAMGEGRNAVFLARKGLAVDGVDLSEVAIGKARRLAKAEGVRINAVNADLRSYAIKPGAYDVIVDIDYLQRDLVPAMKRGLRKGGLVIFENPTVDSRPGTTDRVVRRDQLLEKGELRKLFADFEILVYHEDTSRDGKNARAGIVARKP